MEDTVQKKIRIPKASFDYLASIKTNKQSINSMINLMIAYFMDKDKEKKQIEKMKDENADTVMRLLITKSEFDFLSKEALKNGFLYARREAKFRLLNTIYKDKFYLPLELEELRMVKKELNAIGRNLNAQVKTLQNRKAEIKNFDVAKYDLFLDNITKKIDNLSDELANLILQNKKRFQ